ncbi:Uncharacterised protein [Shigella sonnei]|nr:hypothetical protein SS482266_1359 [Shigella sonnei 4822-66]EJL18694.1 hypothetical protein SSMOSELEY_1619 [Shigella sonnei str. Moseley]CSP55961.1 Uncharacterised protein [Shigella sonnei]CSP92462.1 Uncharacterised protein [Shigella sonnei]
MFRYSHGQGDLYGDKTHDNQMCIALNPQLIRQLMNLGTQHLNH